MREGTRTWDAPPLQKFVERRVAGVPHLADVLLRLPAVQGDRLDEADVHAYGPVDAGAVEADERAVAAARRRVRDQASAGVS